MLAYVVINMMSRWQQTTAKKAKAYKPFENITEKEDIINTLQNEKLPQHLKDAIIENL